MKEENNYIERIIEKLAKVDDVELKEMILNLIEEREYLIKTANIDLLSGLNNRRIIERIRKYEFVSMIDIDGFKTINDTYGHDIGDKIIRIIGSILKSNTRSEDFAIRYGGDEFLIIFTGGNIEVVNERMENICKEVREKINFPDFDVTLSVGIASNEYNSTLDEAIKKADAIMYYSKKSGKNRISIYGNKTKKKK